MSQHSLARAQRDSTLGPPVGVGGAFLSALLAFTISVPAVSQLNGTLGLDNTRLQGTAPTGQLRLYTPDPVQLGSSISHWDTTATPNLLMEPAINPDLPFLGLDVTPDLMADISWSSGSSTFNVLALNPPGEGFTDPTPFPGAPGNPATTLGDARINLFAAVLGAWASTLGSSVPIDVDVAWAPLPCTAGVGAVLGGASTILIFRDFLGALQPGTWHHSALAESILGTDASSLSSESDIFVVVNSSIDLGCLAPGTGFYYGLDGSEPPNQIDLAPVVLHELAHGLGNSNFTNEATGAEFQDLPSVYDLFTLDLATGQTWDQMTDAERVASAARLDQVVWSGSQATSALAGALDPGVLELTINSPAGAAGEYEVRRANFGGSVPAPGLTSDLACMIDWAPSRLDGCQPAANSDDLVGNLALIDRGACSFTTKVANAQAAGAVGAIIINDQDYPATLGGFDPSIVIPAVSISASDGALFRSIACPLGGAAFDIPTTSVLGQVALAAALVLLGFVFLRRSAAG